METFTFCLPDDTNILQNQIRPSVEGRDDLCLHSPQQEKKKKDERVHSYSDFYNTGETEFLFHSSKAVLPFVKKVLSQLHGFGRSIQAPSL